MGKAVKAGTLGEHGNAHVFRVVVCVLKHSWRWRRKCRNEHGQKQHPCRDAGTRRGLPKVDSLAASEKRMLSSLAAVPALHRAEEALTALGASAGPSAIVGDSLQPSPNSSLDSAMAAWWAAAHGGIVHVSGQPSVLFAVMTGVEMHEERAEPVLRTWCGDVQACIFFSDQANGKRLPATCERARPPPSSLAPTLQPLGANCPDASLPHR